MLKLNRIKQLRKESNKSMAEIARDLNIPYTTYVNYEKELREPNSETLILLADYFHCSVDYLICRSNKRIDVSKYNELANTLPCNESEMKLLNNYRLLDFRGKEKMIDYSNDLVNSGNYSNTVTVVTAARSQNNDKPVKVIQTTEEDLKIFDIAPQSDEEL